MHDPTARLERRRRPVLAIPLVPVLACALASTAAAGAGDGRDGATGERVPYRSPFDVAIVPGTEVPGRGAPGDRALLALVSDRDTGVLYGVAIDRAGGRASGGAARATAATRDSPPPGSVLFEIPLRGEPTGIAVAPDGSVAYVAEYGAGSVAEVDIGARSVRRRLAVGLRPLGVGLSWRRRRLVVANTTSHDVSIVDLDTGRQIERVPVPREPFFVAVAPGGSTAVAANLLPAGPASDPAHAACISIIPVEPPAGGAPRRRDIRLPPGSTSVREVAISRDGRWAFAAHTVGRFHLPATQLDRGWINTDALSILDLERGERYVTVLLDSLDRGATDPWGVEVSPAADRVWISLRGTHEIAILDLPPLREMIERDPSLRDRLVNDLTALTRAGVLRRVAVPGRGPRGLALAPEAGILVAAGSFSGSVAVLDAGSGEARGAVELGPPRAPDLIRRGEMLFHDATMSFQSWLSCSSCHPDRGRNDALRWDLLNDGLGTPQMTRSLLKSYLVAPTTARGARPDFQASVTAGFRFLNTRPDPERIAAVMAYLRSLEPERSPHLAASGELTPAQARGRAIFEGKGRCRSCHRGEIRTDLERHDVGSAAPGEIGGTAFYTPKLLELYRTAPFLHDGRAGDLRSIFTRHDRDGRHGGASDLDGDELDDLVAYLLTL